MWCVPNTLHCKLQNLLQVLDLAASMEVECIGCFGAIKQSRRNPRTRLLPGLQPMCPRRPNCSDTDHSTKAVSGQGSDGGSRRRRNGRQESAKGERAEGLMGHGHPVLEALSEPPITGTAGSLQTRTIYCRDHSTTGTFWL